MTADAATDLRRLDGEIRACRRCDLFRTATQAVPGEGPADARIMLVGEAPGASEDRQGRPFVGPAGRFLDELLSMAGLNRQDVYITNIVKHRPPGNRDPDGGEVTACRPWLDQQLAVIKPRMIVTLGRFAMEQVLSKEELRGRGISKVHGEVFQREGRFVVPMLHPAAALHQERWRPDLISDMERLGRFLHSPEWQAGPGAGDDGESAEQLSLF